jgi:hypothetical protein
MKPCIKNVKNLMSRNASDLLLIGGVGCILGGGILAIRQTPKAVQLLKEKEDKNTLEKAKTLTPLYLPSVILTGVGIAQIVCSRNITKNKLAAITTAYTVTETAYKTYRDKVKDIVDPEIAKVIDTQVAEEKIKKNPVWNIKPYSKGQAWVDMIMSANHEPAQLIYGNEVINLERGQFHTSELKLAEEWGWSRKKVRAYLLLLKNVKMATTQATTKGTTVTIENYNDYQCDGTTDGTTEGTLKEQRRNREGYTNNNDKNDKNIYVDFFEQIWRLYPKKEGKGQISDTQKKKLYSIG